MPHKKILIVFLSFFFSKSGIAASPGTCSPVSDQIFIQDTASSSVNAFEVISVEKPNPILQVLRSKQKKKKQIVAALLAFPLPFGIVGLHRIYLGCSPYVPVAYIASLGGMFGVLPFIDFCVLLLNKDTDRYSDNKKIFMWVN